MTIEHVWHFSGEEAVPPQLRVVPVELSESDVMVLTLVYDVLLYRDDAKKLVLALDTQGKRFRQR